MPDTNRTRRPWNCHPPPPPLEEYLVPPAKADLYPRKRREERKEKEEERERNQKAIPIDTQKIHTRRPYHLTTRLLRCLVLLKVCNTNTTQTFDLLQYTNRDIHNVSEIYHIHHDMIFNILFDLPLPLPPNSQFNAMIGEYACWQLIQTASSTSTTPGRGFKSGTLIVELELSWAELSWAELSWAKDILSLYVPLFCFSSLSVFSLFSILSILSILSFFSFFSLFSLSHFSDSPLSLTQYSGLQYIGNLITQDAWVYIIRILLQCFFFFSNLLRLTPTSFSLPSSIPLFF